MKLARKLPVGSQCLAVERMAGGGMTQRYATVLKHGYDHSGIYTEIKYRDNGEIDRVHRSMLQPAGKAGECGLQHLG